MLSQLTKNVATSPLPIGVIAGLVETVCVRNIGDDDMIGMPYLGRGLCDCDDVPELDIEGIAKGVGELDGMGSVLCGRIV